MKRLFGFGKKRKKKSKDRLSPSELSDGFHAMTSPMFQYARNEFAQTVASGTSNDDGRGVLFRSPSETPSRLFAGLRESSLVSNAGTLNDMSWTSPAAAPKNDDENNTFGGSFQSQPTGSIENPPPQQALNSASLITSRNSSLIDAAVAEQQGHRSVESSSRYRQETATTSYQPPLYSNIQSPVYNPSNVPPPTTQSPESALLAANLNNNNTPGQGNLDPDYVAACSASNFGRQESLFSQASSHYPTNNSSQVPRLRSINKNQHLDFPSCWELPDASYEEEYGDAYIGGPIRYIYPSGYQSMRPRSGPWKLSIVICMLFTWLSVFIVGHCSDRVDSNVSQYNQNEIDDDELVIETRWCGSRLLYMMWVISMLVTGLAAAYCSIIGYIKVRDFAVANSRSQPPGMVGRTDFYSQVDDAMPPPIQETSSQGSIASSGHRNNYHMPIYQADGNPQFWGGHIYRPTQAAVATTSR
jgi:hypothetical protein